MGGRSPQHGGKHSQERNAGLLEGEYDFVFETRIEGVIFTLITDPRRAFLPLRISRPNPLILDSGGFRFLAGEKEAR